MLCGLHDKVPGECPACELATLRQKLAEISDAVLDPSLGDGAARAVVMNVLHPVVPTPEDFAWARSQFERLTQE